MMNQPAKEHGQYIPPVTNKSFPQATENEWVHEWVHVLKRYVIKIHQLAQTTKVLNIFLNSLITLTKVEETNNCWVHICGSCIL